MRLWHEALMPYLPRQQLLGLHREVCALRGNGWGKPHSVVNYVFEHPYIFLYAYHLKVMDEMRHRGYKASIEWFAYDYCGKSVGCMSDAAKIVQAINAEGLIEQLKSRKYIYPEHDAAYLQECLDNLAGKGIHIDMEVQNASDL